MANTAMFLACQDWLLPLAASEEEATVADALGADDAFEGHCAFLVPTPTPNSETPRSVCVRACVRARV